VSIINVIWGDNKAKDNFTTETLVVPVLVGDGMHADDVSSSDEVASHSDADVESNGAEQQVQ
jgi:hypothetical protein